MTLLELVKLDLRIADDTHDALIESLIAEATDEALQFMGVSELPGIDSNTEASSESLDVAPSVAGAIRLLVRGKFDVTEADEIERHRKCAEVLMTPYRERWGV